MALVNPDRVETLVVQDAVAHDEGLGRIGSRAGSFGPIALPTKARFVQTFCRNAMASMDAREAAAPAGDLG
jgi:hypothetical protein